MYVCMCECYGVADSGAYIMITITTFILQPAITTAYATMNSSDGIEESKSIPVSKHFSCVLAVTYNCNCKYK